MRQASGKDWRSGKGAHRDGSYAVGGPYLELCAENKIYSQMYRVLCITFGEAHATEWADEEDFLFCLRRLKNVVW